MFAQVSTRVSQCFGLELTEKSRLLLIFKRRIFLLVGSGLIVSISIDCRHSDAAFVHISNKNWRVKEVLALDAYLFNVRLLDLFSSVLKFFVLVLNLRSAKRLLLGHFMVTAKSVLITTAFIASGLCSFLSFMLPNHHSCTDGCSLHS